MLGSLLSNDLLLEYEDVDINSYAYDTDPYLCAEVCLQRYVRYVFCAYRTSKKYQIFFRCYEDNHMKTNPGISHVLLSYNTRRVVSFDNVQITSSLGKKMLGLTFDLELKFEEHISTSCNIVIKKILMLFTVMLILRA